MATTIKLSDETKDLLDQENTDNETYDATVKRLLGETHGTTWTREEIRQIAIEAVQEQSRF